MKRTVPIAKPVLGKEEVEAVRRVFESGVLVQGERTTAFEKEFADYIDVKHGVAIVNGTMALDTVLKALEIGRGDEVVTSAFSFVASSNCVVFQGAKPVFADIDARTFNMDPIDVAEKITTKTKAVIPVHLFGQPAEMGALKEIAEDYNLALVEDAAQAHGAEYKGQKVGSIGGAGCFSFYATKNMTVGEGGIITTDSSELARKARLIRNHGDAGKYHHAVLGYNYRMCEASAAVGSVQLSKLEEMNERRRQNANLLSQGIRRISGLKPPYVKKCVKHVFQQYVITVEERYIVGRDKLAELLKERGVGVAVHYPTAIHKQPFYKELGYENTSCPNAEDASQRVLSIPVHPSVTREDVAYILDVLKEVS